PGTTTKSVPFGSAVSACQTIAVSWPDASFSARAMSRSRLIPGKTRTADFISEQLDPIIFDDSVREQLVGRRLQRGFRFRLVRTGKLNVEHLALTDTGDAIDTERFQCPLDGLALRIENAGLQCNGDARFHSSRSFSP